MDKLKKITALSLIITFFQEQGLDISFQYKMNPCKEEIPDICPEARLHWH